MIFWGIDNQKINVMYIALFQLIQPQLMQTLPRRDEIGSVKD